MSAPSLLTRCRRPAIGWLQLLVVLFWTFIPAFRSSAIYVPSGNGTPDWSVPNWGSPYWVPLYTESEPSGGPEWGDSGPDGLPNNVPDWYDQFQAAVSYGYFVWWPGGSSYNGSPYVIDGVAVSLTGKWHAANDGDFDGDGIPDSLDFYSSDPSNNSYWWPGPTSATDTLTFNGQKHRVRAQWFAGSGMDANGNSVPDCMESLLSSAGTVGLSIWSGGWILTDGQWSWYLPLYYYGYSSSETNGDTGDLDGDGIPNVIDPYPNDPWNNTYYSFGGGSYWVNGIWTYLNGGSYGGIGNDPDGDGIPGDFDPYPSDSTNNTAWWYGGTFLVDGNPMASYEGRYHAANAGDSDVDGIPDDIDPYPNDYYNNSVWWPLGDFIVDGVSVPFAGMWLVAGTLDSDADNLPDFLDTYPTDVTNNSFWWQGGNFTIDNYVYDFPTGWYPGTSADADGDGIPDCLDVHPADVNNGNSFWWPGGYFAVDGAIVFWPADYYPGLWNDADADGIPGSLDIYPNSAANNSGPTFWWGGGSFMVDGSPTIFLGQLCIGALDSLGHFADADGDGIPDFVDPYQNAYFNNTPGFFWPMLDANGNGTSVTYPMGADNHPMTFHSIAYFNVTWVDTDGDGIPDVCDPYGEDYYNANDTDGDGIPDSVEMDPRYSRAVFGGNLYGLSPGDGADVNSLRYVYHSSYGWQTDGLTWKQAYSHGWLDALQDNTADRDADGMTDLYEVINGLEPDDANDAIDAPVGHIALVNGVPVRQPVMNDFILNIEKARAGVPIATVVTDSWEYQRITGHYSNYLPVHDFTKSVAENDWDGDGVSNRDEVLVFRNAMRPLGTGFRNGESRPSDAELVDAYFDGLTSLTTNINFNYLFTNADTDLDGLSDAVEVQYGVWGFDRKVANNANVIRYIGGLTDWLTWKQAFDLGIFGTLLSFTLDTDEDGIPDVVELHYGRNRLSALDADELRYILNPADGIAYTEGKTWKQAYDDGYLDYLYIEAPMNAGVRQTGLTGMELTWEHSASDDAGNDPGIFTIERWETGSSEGSSITRAPSEVIVQWSDGSFGFHLEDSGVVGSSYTYRITYDRYGGQHSAVAETAEFTLLDEAGLADGDSDSDGASDLYEILAGTNPFNGSDKPYDLSITTTATEPVKVKGGTSKTIPVEVFGASDSKWTRRITVNQGASPKGTISEESETGFKYTAGTEAEGDELLSVTVANIYTVGSTPFVLASATTPEITARVYQPLASPGELTFQVHEDAVDEPIPLIALSGCRPVKFEITTEPKTSVGDITDRPNEGTVAAVNVEVNPLESSTPVKFKAKGRPFSTTFFNYKITDDDGDSFTVKVNVEITGMEMPQDEPTVTIVGHAPGTKAAPGGVIPGDTAFLQPNSDNDDEPGSMADPPPKDNKDTQTQIGPDDDDIVKLEIYLDNKGTVGTFALNVPPGVRVFKQDGTVKTDTELDTSVSPIVLYVEGLDSFTEGELSANYEYEEEPALIGEGGSPPAAASGTKRQVTGKEKLRNVLAIRSVSFDGDKYWQLKSDDGNINYSAPQFVMTDDDKGKGNKNYPVAFSSGSKPRLGLTVSIDPAANVGVKTVYVDATLSDGMKLENQAMVKDATTGQYKLGDSQTPATLKEVTTGKFSDKIQFWNGGGIGLGESPFEIKWKLYTKQGTTAVPIGVATTYHTVYVTRGDPTWYAKFNETIFNIACRNANSILNSADETTVVDAIFGDFTDKVVSRVTPASGNRLKGPDFQDEKLVYWKTTKDPRTLSGLLIGGSGSCGAFAKLFAYTLTVHGIDVQLTSVTPKHAPNAIFGAAWQAANPGFPEPSGQQHGFFIGDWNIAAPFSPIEPTLLEAQGTKKPSQNVFGDHGLVPYGGKYYDPSYGKALDSLQDWEDASVKAYGRFWKKDVLVAGTEITLEERWVWETEHNGVRETQDRNINLYDPEISD